MAPHEWRARAELARRNAMDQDSAAATMLSPRSPNLARRANLGGGPIAGIVVGSVVGFFLILLCGYPLVVRWLLKRKQNKEKGSVDGDSPGSLSQDGADGGQSPSRQLTRRVSGAGSFRERGPVATAPSRQSTKDMGFDSMGYPIGTQGMDMGMGMPQQMMHMPMQMQDGMAGPSGAQAQGMMPATYGGVPYPITTYDVSGFGTSGFQDPNSAVDGPTTNYITAQGQNALYYDPLVSSEALGMTRMPTMGPESQPRSDSLRTIFNSIFRSSKDKSSSGSTITPMQSANGSPNNFILAQQSTLPEGIALGNISHSPITMTGPSPFDMPPPPQPRTAPTISAIAIAMSSSAATPGVPCVPTAAMESGRKSRSPPMATTPVTPQPPQNTFTGTINPVDIMMPAPAMAWNVEQQPQTQPQMQLSQQTQPHQEPSIFTDPSHHMPGPDGMTDAEFVASIIASGNYATPEIPEGDASWQMGQLGGFGDLGVGAGGLPTSTGGQLQGHRYNAGGNQANHVSVSPVGSFISTNGLDVNSHHLDVSPALTPEHQPRLFPNQPSPHTPIIQDPNHQFHQFISQPYQQQQQQQPSVIIKPEYSPIPNINMIEPIGTSYQLDANSAALKQEHRISGGSDISHLTYRSDMSNLPYFHNSAFPSSTQNTPATSGFSPGSHDSPPDARQSTSPLPIPNPQLSPKLYTCNKCEKEFDQFHKLNHHMRYHDKIHACTYPNCGKSFGTKTHLHRHVNDIHERAKKYHCTEPGCAYSRTGGRSFPRKDNLRRHLLNIHQVVPQKDPEAEAADAPMDGA